MFRTNKQMNLLEKFWVDAKNSYDRNPNLYKVIFGNSAVGFLLDTMRPESEDSINNIISFFGDIAEIADMAPSNGEKIKALLPILAANEPGFKANLQTIAQSRHFRASSQFATEILNLEKELNVSPKKMDNKTTTPLKDAKMHDSTYSTMSYSLSQSSAPSAKASTSATKKDAGVHGIVYSAMSYSLSRSSTPSAKANTSATKSESKTSRLDNYQQSKIYEGVKYLELSKFSMQERTHFYTILAENAEHAVDLANAFITLRDFRLLEGPQGASNQSAIIQNAKDSFSIVTGLWNLSKISALNPAQAQLYYSIFIRPEIAPHAMYIGRSINDLNYLGLLNEEEGEQRCKLIMENPTYAKEISNALCTLRLSNFPAGKTAFTLLMNNLDHVDSIASSLSLMNQNELLTGSKAQENYHALFSQAQYSDEIAKGLLSFDLIRFLSQETFELLIQHAINAKKLARGFEALYSARILNSFKYFLIAHASHADEIGITLSYLNQAGINLERYNTQYLIPHLPYLNKLNRAFGLLLRPNLLTRDNVSTLFRFIQQIDEINRNLNDLSSTSTQHHFCSIIDSLNLEKAHEQPRAILNNSNTVFAATRVSTTDSSSVQLVSSSLLGSQNLAKI